MQSSGGRQTLCRAGSLLRRAASAGTSSASTASVRAYSSTNPRNERIVVAVGGNALQRRGERLSEF